MDDNSIVFASSIDNVKYARQAVDKNSKNKLYLCETIADARRTMYKVAKDYLTAKINIHSLTIKTSDYTIYFRSKNSSIIELKFGEFFITK